MIAIFFLRSVSKDKRNKSKNKQIYLVEHQTVFLTDVLQSKFCMQVAILIVCSSLQILMSQYLIIKIDVTCESDSQQERDCHSKSVRKKFNERTDLDEIYTLQYIQQLIIKELLYSTGKSTQFFIMKYMGKALVIANTLFQQHKRRLYT